MDRTALTVAAPAKLNLFLHVTGRRNDGYHTLESLMVLLDFGDRLTVSVRGDNEIAIVSPIPGVAVEDDLTWRAARLLQDHACVAAGATIALDKRIPIGAGMGGGSSDAASVLLVLNRLWNTGLSRAQLMRLGLELGADVPFFIFGTNAHASGIGETLREVSVPRLRLLIDIPPVQSLTRDIFLAPALVRNTPPTGGDAFRPDFGRNDLQAVALARHREIGEALAALDRIGSRAGREGAREAGSAPALARMTGSGAAVFRIVGRSGAGASREHHMRIEACVIPSHPLRDFAAK